MAVSVQITPGTDVINRYRTPRLNKMFGSYFLVFGKYGVTPHRLYRGSLTLINASNLVFTTFEISKQHTFAQCLP